MALTGGEAAGLAVDQTLDTARNQGTKRSVAAAAEAFARRFAVAHKAGSVSKAVSKRLPWVDTAFESAIAGKALLDRRKPGVFDRQADEGDAMLRTSVANQVLKNYISPAEYHSTVGASVERRDKKRFEAMIDNPKWQRAVDAATNRRDFAAENRAAQLRELSASLEPPPADFMKGFRHQRRKIVRK